MEFMTYMLLALGALLFIRRMMPAKGIRNISTEQLKAELKDKNKQFVDVRTPGEFKGNHIRGFKNIPLHQLAAKAASLLKDKEIVVICQSGMRSQKASRELKKLGFEQITNVKGGVSAWRP
ncbi:rhodanese-like domain-containing protein [Mesobacillus zeae]|uniref:Rhodanese-like domain-containing protein n=1 Tax=Mesobacillus zeae TaxID=1917180 RepID=A0A398B3J5_9BACI|nr:rhodanese-like domain-containing protein [Mesobacillus zeae]RID82333.1 rhodanese-like domain-containing protein [Mesobacillus zeae]